MKDHDMTEVTTTNPPSDDVLLRVPAITQRIGCSRSYWWAGVKAGRFPQGIKLSERVTVWRRSDIDRMIQMLGK